MRESASNTVIYLILPAIFRVRRVLEKEKESGTKHFLVSTPRQR